MVDPKIMCRQHLLGEHVEIHMFIRAIELEKSVKGYLQKGLLEIHNLYCRHQELAKEMKRRGYNHFSEIDKKWKFAAEAGVVDKKESINELTNRCSECKARYSKLRLTK